MISRLLVVLVLFLSTVSLAGAQGFKQAPREVELSIGRQTHLLIEGVPTSLEIGGRKVSVKVLRRESASLKFDKFSFYYPSNFNLLQSRDNSSPSSTSWMLRSKTSQVTIHRKDKDTTLKFLVKHMSDYYSNLSNVKSLREQSVKFKLGNKDIQGVRFVMNTRGEGTSHQDYFQLPLKSSRSNYFLVIHAKPHDAEADRVKRMIGSTLK